MATNNSKSFYDLPATMQLFELTVVFWNLELLFIFNPLTLLLLNIFKPRWARSMAYCDALYDKNSQKFFSRQARKWPWRWAKWWYTREELKELSVERQLDYYYDVNQSAKTLAAMSSEAAFRVIDDGLGNNFEDFKKNINEIKLSPELFRAFIQKSFKEDDMSTLSDYLKCGTLPKDLVESLADEAGNSTSGIYSNTWLALVFYDYVERCGLSQELLNKLLERPNSAHFKKEVERRQGIYEQRVFTKSQRGTKQTDAWLAFCETTKDICPQAQMEMGLDQYHVFHKTGHTLDAEAILHILKHNSDRMMAQLIFEYEPNYGIVSDDIKEFLDNNMLSKCLRDSVIENHLDDLQRRIYGNEKLTEEELTKVFDYPNAGQLIFNYVTRYPLPENLHKRLFELPERACACILMYHRNEVSPEEWCSGEFHLADDVRREAERRGWIPEKKA